MLQAQEDSVEDDPCLPADRILDVAEELFYSRGISAVSMRDIRAAAGVSLKRLYGAFSSRDELVTRYLQRRSERKLAMLCLYLDTLPEDPATRIAAVFEGLDDWFHEPTFNGCAFVNARGELDGLPMSARLAVLRHTQDFRAVLAGRVLMCRGDGNCSGQGGVSGENAAVAELFLLVEGAITAATVGRDLDAAKRAGRVAQTWWSSCAAC